MRFIRCSVEIDVFDFVSFSLRFFLCSTFTQFTHPPNWFRFKFYCDFHSTRLLSCLIIGYIYIEYKIAAETSVTIYFIDSKCNIGVCVFVSFDSLHRKYSMFQIFPVIILSLSSFDPNNEKLQQRLLKWCLCNNSFRYNPIVDVDMFLIFVFFLFYFFLFAAANIAVGFLCRFG